MDGIDISRWQAGINLSAVTADFIICKATEGNGYTDPEFVRFAKEIKRLKRARGFYHFCRADLNPGTAGAKKEAEWFVKVVTPYLDGETLLVLDWEAGAVSHGPKWAKVWLDHVQKATGVRPLVYTSTSVANGWDWSKIAPNHPLWLANYGTNPVRNGYLKSPTVPKLKHWDAPAIYQYGSQGRLPGWGGNLDLNRAYITAAEWKALGGGGSSSDPTGSDLVAAARKYLGVPYVWGGNSKNGLDCSGLIVKSLEDVGARGNFPRVSADQINACAPIPVRDALNTPGALVWFDGHDALTLGDGKTTIEAVVNPGNSVQIFNAPGRWTKAGLIPGINYGREQAPVARMQSPVEGRVTSEFSRNRKNPVTGRVEPHLGIDIAAPAGTPYYPVYPGTVIGVGAGLLPGRSGDRNVRVRNPDGETQYYGHGETVSVKVGQKVDHTTPLGTVGQRGNATGPHVHLEIHDKNGVPRNPRIDFNHHGITPGSKPNVKQKGSWFDMATKQDLEDAIWSVLGSHNINISGATKRSLGVDKRSTFALLRYAAAALFEGREQHADLVAQNKALTAAVETLATSQGLDPVDVTNAVNKAVTDALADLKVTLTVNQEEDLED